MDKRPWICWKYKEQRMKERGVDKYCDPWWDDYYYPLVLQDETCEEYCRRVEEEEREAHDYDAYCEEQERQIFEDDWSNAILEDRIRTEEKRLLAIEETYMRKHGHPILLNDKERHLRRIQRKRQDHGTRGNDGAQRPGVLDARYWNQYTQERKDLAWKFEFQHLKEVYLH